MNIFLNETNFLYDWNKNRYFSSEDMREKFKDLEQSMYATNKAPNPIFSKNCKIILSDFQKQLNSCKTEEDTKTFLKDIKYAQNTLLKWSDDAVSLSRMTKANIAMVAAGIGLAFVMPASLIPMMLGGAGGGGLGVSLMADNIEPIYRKIVRSDVSKLYKDIEKLRTIAMKKLAKFEGKSK